MKSTSESSQQEETSAKRPLHEEQSLLADHVVPEDSDVSINSSDVLCGRGKTSFNHVGNKQFRELISASLNRYMQAENRFEKSVIVHTIVNGIQSKGGRFLKKDSATGRWVELQEQQAKEKVGHAIRDAVNSFEARRARESNVKRLKDPPKSTSSPTGFDHSHQHQQVALSASIVPHQYSPPSENVNLASRPLLQQSSHIGEQALGLPAAVALMEYHHHHQHPHNLGPLQQQQQPPYELQAQQLPHFHLVQQQYAGHLQQHAGHLHQLQPDQELRQFHQNPPESGDGEEKEENEHHFLQHIDEVLGPLPPNAKDPMEHFLDEHDRHS